MIDKSIKFNCGNVAIEFHTTDLTRQDAFRETLEKRTLVDMAYIHEGHGHLLQISRDYRSRDTTTPSDVYYNTRTTGNGRHVQYGCRACDAKFMFTIPEPETDGLYACFHIVQKGYERLHYLWIKDNGTVKHAQHIDFFIRAADPKPNGTEK